MQKNSQTSFFLELKIKGEMHKLPITTTDTRQSISRKLQVIYPDCIRHEDKMIRKIQQEMIGLSMNTSISGKLRRVIKRCLETIFVFAEDSMNSGQISQVQQPKRAKTCFDQIRMIPATFIKNRATQTENSPRIENSLKQSQLQMEIQAEVKSMKNKSSVSNLGDITINSINKENAPQRERKSAQQSKTVKKNINPDIVKACEVIMRKHAHSDMKTMAKEFLKEKGYLKEDQNHKRKMTVAEISQPTISNPEMSVSVQLSKKRERSSIRLHTYASDSVQQRTQSSHILLHHRYKYLQSSMDALKNTYEERREQRQVSLKYSPPAPALPKKYKYLDD